MAQSFAKIPGHLLWGVQSGKFGGRVVLFFVMVLNAITFAASAVFAISGLPLNAIVGLLGVRLLAGFCAPIVPGFVFLFERQEPGPALVASVGKIGGGILTGLTLGGVAVAIPFGAPAAIWAGVCLLSAAMALLVLIPVYKAPPVLTHVVAMRKQKPVGVRKALLTNEYISHGLTSLASGWTVTMLTAVPAVHYALYFAFSVPIISVCFISSSATTFFTAIYVVPAICKRYCIARSIYIGHCWQLVMMIVLSLPWVNRSPVAYPICIAVSQIGLCLAVNPNQNRSSTIGRMHTVNGTGALTGVTRVLFSCGESTGPLVGILLLYPIGTLGGPSDPRIGTLLPFMVTAALHVVVLTAYALLRISPNADPVVKPQQRQAQVQKQADAEVAVTPTD